MRRVQMRAGSMLLALVMLVSILSVPALAASFTDTDGHWAETAIDRWSEYNVVRGMDDGSFQPDGRMTRAQAAQVFANLLNLTGTADLSAYKDVDPDAWYVPAIAACVAKGILNGVRDDAMDPNGPITREMFFVMFARALGIAPETQLDVAFADSESISAWAAGYVYALVNHGYVSGTSDNTLSPLSYINHASVIALLDQTLTSYVVQSGTETVTEDGVVLVLADSATITGNAAITVAVVSEAATVSLEGFEGEVRVIVLEDNVQITNAPAGTEIITAEDVSGTSVNGTVLSDDTEFTVPEESTSASVGGGGGGSVTPEPEENEAQKAVESAWAALGKGLADFKGYDGAQLVTADQSGDVFALTLDVDAIMAGSAAVEEDVLSGLATRFKAALDETLGAYALTVADESVYVDQTFQNTALKNALFSVADGFFYRLANMEPNGEVYTYKTVDARADGEDSYSFSIAVQLKGEDVGKVKELAGTLADHLSMEKLDAGTVTGRYGQIDLNGEEEVFVITMEMPDALMEKAAEMAGEVAGDRSLQDVFDAQTVGEYLDLMDDFTLDELLGSGVSGINSLLTTVNSNEALVNKVLGKMTVSVNGTNFFTEEHGTFAPGTSGDAWQDFLSGVTAMTNSDIKAMNPGLFKSTGSMNGTYYAVPVAVHIDLGDSMGFTATETVVVVLHIDFSKYETSEDAADNTAGMTDSEDVTGE